MVLYSFHLFSGAGGGILADIMLGHIPIGAVEIEPYCREALLARQADLILPRFPIWDDVKTFRSDNSACSLFIERLVGMSEELVISGGFPCQDISVAGKGVGITGERSGLWKEMYRIVCEVRPRYVFVENVPALTRRGLDIVLGDLASIGYDAEWCVLGADDCGAPHYRKRIWILAYSRHLRGRSEEQGAIRESEKNELQCDTITGSSETRDARGLHIRHGRPFETEADTLWNCENVSNTISEHDDGTGYGTGEMCREPSRKTEVLGNSWWEVEPGIGRVVDGMACRVDRIRALGNGQVALCAAIAWQELLKRVKEE